MLKDLFIHVCIVITFLFIGGIALRRNPIVNNTLQKVALGSFAGILGSFLMMFSIHLTPTIIMDYRHIAILLSAVYGGFISTLISLIIICLSRAIFFSGSSTSLLISISMMVCIGTFATVITRLNLSELKKWIYMYLFSLITLTVGFLYLLGVSNKFYDLMFKYWLISIIAGAFIFYCANFITQSNRVFNEMKKDSTTDFLTGLHNVRFFDAKLHTYIEKANIHSEKLSFLMIDVDHFKKVNDTFGHKVGDEVLRKLGALLSSYARSSDIVSRMGGEEFSVLLVDCHHTQALEIAERIRHAVENFKFNLPNGTDINITISIGVATYLETTSRADQLLYQADDALYRAKRIGRNNVCSPRVASGY